MEDTLAAGGTQDPEIYNRHSQISEALSKTMTAWEQAGEELESLRSKIEQ